MSKQLRVKVNGNPYEVEIKEFSGVNAEVSVNGTSYEIEIEEAGGTVATPVSKPTPFVSAAPAKPAPTPVAPAAAAVSIATAGSTDVISAPMPGVILNILVKAGDVVKAGDTVCSLEAMKMKNLIRSPREGTVASVEVSEGQRVPFGAVIIRFA